MAEAGTATAADLLRGWPGIPGLGALMTDRSGGSSGGAWRGFNLGDHVGDDPHAVMHNRQALTARIGAQPVWLQQVHGRQVARLVSAQPLQAPADAAVTAERGLACAVLVADCLPVLLADRQGRAVGAAHAGWRGLAAGVLEATVDALCALTGDGPASLTAWLGPCIGPSTFEVGEDVLQAFGVPPQDAAAAAGGDGDLIEGAARRFMPRGPREGRLRWQADLAGLACDRLQAAGVSEVRASGRCTVGDASRFFSFRRDGSTGRMAALVWRR